eukprot:147301-Pelagomonas_calceolata.AAC.2
MPAASSAFHVSSQEENTAGSRGQQRKKRLCKPGPVGCFQEKFPNKQATQVPPLRLAGPAYIEPGVNGR